MIASCTVVAVDGPGVAWDHLVQALAARAAQTGVIGDQVQACAGRQLLIACCRRHAAQAAALVRGTGVHVTFVARRLCRTWQPYDLVVPAVRARR